MLHSTRSLGPAWMPGQVCRCWQGGFSCRCFRIPEFDIRTCVLLEFHLLLLMERRLLCTQIFHFAGCLLRDRRIIDRYGLTHLGRSGTPPLVGINIGTFCVEQSVVRGKCSSEWTEPSSATGVLGIPFCVCLGRGTMPLV